MPDLYSGSFHILVEFHRKKLTLLIYRVISRFFFQLQRKLIECDVHGQTEFLPSHSIKPYQRTDGHMISCCVHTAFVLDKTIMVR